MQRSIRARLTIVLTCLLLGGALVQGLLQSTQTGAHLIRTTRRQMLTQAHQLALTLSMPAEERKNIVTQLAAVGGQRLTLFGPEGSVLADSGMEDTDTAGEMPEITAAWATGEGWDVRQNELTKQNMLYVAVVGNLPDEKIIVRLATPLQAIQEELGNYWLVIGMATLVIAIIAILAVIWLSRDLTQPIEKITQAAQSMAAGDFQSPIVIDRHDELGILAESFNKLATSNQRRYEEIMATKAQLDTVIQNTVSGIFLLDAAGTVSLSNPRAGQTLGFDPLEGVPDHFSRLVADQGLQRALQSGLAERKPYSTIVDLVLPIKRTIELHVVPVPTGDRFVAVFYDISEASRLASTRADLVANVSHELKTPVTSIHGFAETLLDENLVSDESGKRFIEIIYRESWRLLRLVNDLLDLSYLELDPNAIEQRPIDLVHILQDVVERDTPLAAEKDVSLKLVIGVQSAITIGDDYRLSQAFDNLIGNAIKYTLAGGEIQVNLQYETNGFQIAVRDTGLGIEAEHLGRVFERFYRTDRARSRKHGGTGLGLSIVKHVIELHGGHVWVESKVNEGTTFYVHLPSQAGKGAQEV